MAVNNFPSFSKIVASSFKKLGKRVFTTDISGDDLYDLYLASFPEGTDPRFRERTEHDCSCCKQFIRSVGNAVSLSAQGEITTVWSDAANKAVYPYDVVATALDAVVKAKAVNNIFLTEENSFGKEETISLTDDYGTERWNHFFTGPIVRDLVSSTPDATKGDYRTTVEVNMRGLKELNPEAVATVLELIDTNALYRGSEHREAVLAFSKTQKAYNKLNAKQQVAYAWLKSTGTGSRFRNTVIGTLVTDLSDGVELEKAVASFEAKVAPQNYKRTSALITPGMVKKAMGTINELGLEPALERRFARMADISVNDVLWVDGDAAPVMKGGLLEGELMVIAAATGKKKNINPEDAEDITLEKFMVDVLPKAKKMEVLLKGEHLGNLMSLTAPVDPEPKQLFKWDNDFAWSYLGNIADSSIKSRVKRAGGNVTNAQLRVSLSWFNTDDLDIQVMEPRGSRPISYGNKVGQCGGKLDVDMNVSPDTREAVENVSWENAPMDGPYKVAVHNYTHREREDVGFVIEVECQGKLMQFNYPKMLAHNKVVRPLTLNMKDGRVDSVSITDNDVTTTEPSQNKWGLTTEEFVKVTTVTLSPNYWGENEVGNKHTFFVLDGAENDEPTRGIYNEFLNSRLEAHRKVFEIIGDRTKCQPTEGQLSGLGFSSTKKDSVIVKVTGKKQRLFNVQVGV